MGAKMSRWYATPAFPVGSGPDFINAAIALQNDAPPIEVLSHLHRIERMFGRERTLRWGPRTLDLDLIAADDMILPDLTTWRHWHDLPADRQSADTPEQLILPHPRLQDRAFVLVPLMDIAPDWVHPALRRSIAEMHADLTAEDLEGVRILADSACQ